MSVLVYAENINGEFHKPAFEAVTYGFDLAKAMNTELVVATISSGAQIDANSLSQYGAKNMVVIEDSRFASFNSGAVAKSISQLAKAKGCDTIVLTANFNGKAIAPRLAALLDAGIVTNVSGMADLSNGFTVRKPVYSGKGFGSFNITSPNKVISIAINSYVVKQNPVDSSIEKFTPQLEDSDFPVKVVSTRKEQGKINLTEAERVVSAGRGMKGPENWNMIEELADILGAATACSKPVSDMDWRPHSEHVGQTGLTVAPNLYIAVGISGAIQHLAGVSNSKVIVVINKDAEAPFFKAADYGIVGDAFEVLPRLIDAAKKLKAKA